MAILHSGDIADHVVAIQSDLGEMRVTDIAADTQEYIAFNQLTRRNRVTHQGSNIQWNVMKTTSGQAKWVGLFNVDNPNVGDVLATGTVPWRHANVPYVVDLREDSMNSGERELVSLVQTRRADALVSFAELLEDAFWSVPGTTDTGPPFGLPYWMVYNATTGFNGGNPTNFSGGSGGIDSSTVTRWRNFSGQYTTVSKTDLIRKMREASTKTRFVSVTQMPQYNTGDMYGYYTTYSVVQSMEELLENQNDNLGNDLASKDGRVLFRGNPVVWAPKLDELGVTGDPVYGINWGTFKTHCLTGWALKETVIRPENNSTQHTVVTTHMDTSCQFVCKDRRRNFVLATSTNQ